ncbi:MAG: serpin family protein [Candidatus Eremiobacteraeota bacterium]|nr:serpin family protein [Candidatus Eremiobacteraeota bacterium]
MRKWWWGIGLIATAWAAGPGTFAWESTQRVTEQETSLVYSPHSARATLRLLFDAGAVQLAPLCQFQADEPALRPVGWQSAQAVFLGQGVHVPPKYPSSVHPLDFSKPTACNEINNWVSQHTAGHIQSLVTRQDLPASTAVAAVSAVYLKSSWVHPFDPKNTSKQPFFPKGNVEMMNQTGVFALYHDPEFTILEMPYKEGQLVFDCCLPVREDGLSQVRRRLTPGHLETIWGVLEESRLAVQVGLPKFRLQSRLDLLKSLTIPDPISLPGFSIGSTRVDVLVQQANLDVDEFGTVASAATAAVVSRSLPESFVADHPFLFWIRDRSNGTVLFSGQFCGD